MAINTESQGYQTAANGENGGAFEHGKKMVDEARAFGSALSSGASNFSQTIDLKGRVQRNPIAMVCVAAGVGYLLGGGLFSPTTSRLLKIGVRLALVPFIKSQLSTMVGQATSGRSSDLPGF